MHTVVHAADEIYCNRLGILQLLNFIMYLHYWNLH